VCACGCVCVCVRPRAKCARTNPSARRVSKMSNNSQRVSEMSTNPQTNTIHTLRIRNTTPYKAYKNIHGEYQNCQCNCKNCKNLTPNICDKHEKSHMLYSCRVSDFTSEKHWVLNIYDCQSVSVPITELECSALFSETITNHKIWVEGGDA